jgi:hypothetical protein
MRQLGRAPEKRLQPFFENRGSAAVGGAAAGVPQHDLLLLGPDTVLWLFGHRNSLSCPLATSLGKAGGCDVWLHLALAVPLGQMFGPAARPMSGWLRATGRPRSEWFQKRWIDNEVARKGRAWA